MDLLKVQLFKYSIKYIKPELSTQYLVLRLVLLA